MASVSCVLPSLSGRYLDTLIGIRHHSNEQINQHYDRDEHVNAEYDLKEDLRPEGLVIMIDRVIGVDFHSVGGGLAENREKQQLESSDWVLLDWNHETEQTWITWMRW